MIIFDAVFDRTGYYTTERVKDARGAAMIDENELLTSWASGGSRGDAAFVTLFRKYNKKVRKDAKNLGRDPDDASQDVWLRLTDDRYNGRLPSFGTFEAYLYRLTQKACSRDAVGVGEPASLAMHEITTADLPSTSSTEDVVSAAQLSELISSTVATMPDETRNAWAHKRRGDTDDFAAQQLGISEATYQRRVADARAIIRECLAKHTRN